MGSTTKMAFHVNCCARRSPVLPNFHQFKTKLASSYKPITREFQILHLLIDDVSKTMMKNASVKLVDAFVDSVFQFIDQPCPPSQSNFAPVDELKEAVPITSVEGKIPFDFPEGVYMRNGPNPLFGGLKWTSSIFGKTGHIWIEGEGMIHALYFEKATGRDDYGSDVVYRCRHVETQTFKLEKERNKPSFLPTMEGHSPAILLSFLTNWLRFGKINKDLSNTNIFGHSGKVYSIAESYVPQEIDIFTLQTLADWDVNGSWNRAFTSHPKRAPGSGELVIIGVDATKPFMELGVISADGRKLVHKVDLKFNRCTLSHDMGVTERYNVVMDFPLTVDIHRLTRGGPLIQYDRNEYARIGIMPRYGDAESIRWFEVEPNCTFHVLNSFEDGDEVVVRGCRSLASILSGPDDMDYNKYEWKSGRLRHKLQSVDDRENYDELLFCRVYEWRLNLKNGEVLERNLTTNDLSMEFPMIHENFVGLKNKYGYTQVGDNEASATSGMPKFGSLAKLYFEEQETSGMKVEYHQFEKNTFCSGAAFVPREGGIEEDDGWIITFVHSEDTNTSKVYIIDTKKFSNEPVAKITLPSRVPYGFHGAYIRTSSQSSAKSFS